MTDKKKKARRLKKTAKELLPVCIYDSETDLFEMEDGTCMDRLQVHAKDLINCSEDDVEYDCLRFAKAYRLYADDVKIVCLNFPCSYTRQKQFLQYQIQQTKNEIFKELLSKKRDELVWLEKNNTTREYYFMLFAKNKEQMGKNRQLLFGTLRTGRDGLVRKIDQKKKEDILYRLYNKCNMMND